jgi:aryl-alcohol dehydrogenase-like predicted oxidoreductase
VEYRRLGLAGATVSAVGVGCNQFGGAADAPTSARIVQRALELGVTHFDTAESYGDGRSEDFLGRALKGHRDEVVIATKTGSLMLPEGRLSRRAIVARLDASLKRLGTDHVDLYYLHFEDPGTPLEESLRALDDMVRAGKVLYPALSNHPAWKVALGMGICDRRGFAPPVVTQDPYNLIERDVEAELLPACRHFGLSLIPYFPLAAGFLTGKYRRGEEPPAGSRGHRSEGFRRKYLVPSNFDALDRFQRFAAERGRDVAELAVAWLLARPEVCSVITGATSPEQVEANVKAAEWKLALAEAQSLAA